MNITHFRAKIGGFPIHKLYYTGGPSFCKSADTRGSLHMQGSRQESGTTNALEIQQEQKRKYNENLKVRGDYSPMEEDFFQQNDLM